MKKPNVLFIFADEWRAQATGYNGDPNCETPVLDSLAAESLNLTHAVSGCPVCCPYRASLLTGQYPLTHGVFINDVELDPDCMSIARAFKAGGYHTGYIGKWHVHGSPDGRNERRKQPVPRSHQMGFDQWMGFECSHDHLKSGYYQNDDPELYSWNDYDAFGQAREAVRQMKAQREGDPPFLKIVSWGPPHFPLNNAPEPFRERYAERDIILRDNVPEAYRAEAREQLKGYYAHIAALDAALKIILDGVREAGLEDNTIVIVTSDHGDMRSSQGLQTKLFPWDESIRVPFLMRYPGLEGELPIRIDAPDIMPTLLGFCGLDIPGSVEGRDWSPEIRREKEADPDHAAFLNMAAEYTELQFNGMRAYRGLRTERHTYVRSLDGPWLLYDNETDPYQMDNLIGKPEHSALQASMETRLQALLEERGDAFLDGRVYLERAGLLHYKETQCSPLQHWRDPWKDGGPVPVEGKRYVIA